MACRPLVLSYIEGYSARDVAPFVKTLRATGYSGDVVFFTSKVTEDCSALFAEYDIRQVPVNRLDLKQQISVPEPLSRWLGLSSASIVPDRSINIRLSHAFRRLGLGKTALAWTLAKHLWHCQSGRFFYFQEFLAANPQYTSVLISDARDVVFQRSPFDFDGGEALYVFEEYPETPLGEQRDNAGWIENLYGASALDELAGYPVICVGLLLGARAKVEACVRAMTEQIIVNYAGWGTDQGIPNYLIRTGRLSGVQVVPYASGPAMHVGIAPRDSIRTDDRGRVLNKAGEVCNIVHQYDRHPDLAEALLEPVPEDSGAAPIPG